MQNQIIPEKRLREIAIAIKDGATCYIGIATAKIEYLINEPKNDKEKKQNEKLLALVDKEPDEYLKIGDLPKEDLLECMRNFADEIKDSRKAKELKNALNRKNPTRNFMQGIDFDMEYSLYWETFTINWRTDWVAEFIIAAHNY